MTNTLAHRGPDDSGVGHYQGATFGHRRLSILDVAGGQQPMSSPRGKVHIVFNGEIYNFAELRAELAGQGVAFRTNSDTEVILALYEKLSANCVDRLQGMFAFAIWDESRQLLFMARDRMGQKPLFYRRVGDEGIAFASEVKALLGGEWEGSPPADLNVKALYHYMSLRFIPDNETLFRGIYNLPPAHTLTFRRGAVSLKQYWSVSYICKTNMTLEDAEDEMEQKLRASVTAHSIADVPAGTLLSGGIDSSLVTAMFADQSPGRVPTFSIGVGEQQFNELPFAKKVADKWNTEHFESTVSADIVQLVPKMIWHMDEPSDPFGVGMYLAAAAASKHVKVVLTGDGGDELFAGYDRFAGNMLVDMYAAFPEVMRRSLVPQILRWLPDTFGYKTMAQKIRWVNTMSMTSGGERYAMSMMFHRFTDDDKRSLFEPAVLAGLSETNSAAKILEHYNATCVTDALDRMLHTDCMTRLPAHLLLLVDRMSMAHGVEARPPMLDHSIVEFAARLPADYKLRGRKLKYILRRVGERYLPKSITARGKQGFGFPIAKWMVSDLRGLLQGVFKSSQLQEAGIFRKSYMDQLLAEHLSGKCDHNYRLWILLNLELWHRMYIGGSSIHNVTESMERLMHRSRCGQAAGNRDPHPVLA